MASLPNEVKYCFWLRNGNYHNKSHHMLKADIFVTKDMQERTKE